jgi:hypothetical protein
MNMIGPYEKGWQLLSDSAPVVVARTWANTSDEAVFLASRARFTQFQAGVVEVKMHGSSESSGDV